MAEKGTTKTPLLKGSKTTVTIVDLLPDVVIVVLKHGAKTYQGALFDLCKDNLCHGIDLKRTRLREMYKTRVDKETMILKPLAPKDDKSDLSSLVERHTYSLDNEAVEPKWLSSPKKDIGRPLISKNINKMRLRPRQVLCTVCKKALPGSTNNAKTKQSSSKPSEGQLCKTVSLPVNNNKRKVTEPVEQVPLKKSKPAHIKSSPAIKISFASPKGVGTVLKIPPRPSTPNPSDSELSQDNCESQTPQHQVQFSSRHDKGKNKGSSAQIVTKANSVDVVKVKHDKKLKHNRHKSKKKAKELSKSKKKVRNKGHSKENLPCGGSELNSSREISTSRVITDSGRLPSDSSLKCKVVLEKLDKRRLSSNSNAIPVNSEDSSGVELNEDTEHVSCTHTPSDSVKSVKSHRDKSNEVGSSNFDCDDSANDEFNYQDYFEDISDSDDSTCLQIDESPNVPGSLEINDENSEPVKPLTMKIQTRNVFKCELSDGRVFHEGDIVWGKIIGFPWWPGKITAIYESLKDFGTIIAQTAHVSWFGSSTMSVMQCSELFPFLEYYKEKFNKKKRGPYKVAIKQATIMAHGGVNNEHLIDSTNTTYTFSERKPLSDSCDDRMIDVTSTISSEHSAFDSVDHMEDMSPLGGEDEQGLEVTDSITAALPGDNQEVPSISQDLNMVHRSSSEHIPEIYDADDVNFEIDESNCVAPSDVFRPVELRSARKSYNDLDSDLEEGEILSDSND